MQRIDVTKSTERVTDFVRRLGRKNQPVDILLEGKIVGRMLPVSKAKAPAESVTMTERKAAWKRIQQLQRKVGRAMREQGITETDVLREILEDD